MGIHRFWARNTLWKTSCKTKVTDFDVTLAIKEDICWFDVSMHDVTMMNKRNCDETVVDNLDQVVFSKVDLMLHQLV